MISFQRQTINNILKYMKWSKSTKESLKKCTEESKVGDNNIKCKDEVCDSGEGYKGEVSEDDYKTGHGGKIQKGVREGYKAGYKMD